MATGDVTLSLAIEGGVTKTVVLDSATRALARTHTTKINSDIDTDTKWAVMQINRQAQTVLSEANQQAQSAASWTPKTFTAAT